MSTNNNNLQIPGLSGLRVAVTAGAGGIGLEIARSLHEHGARLAISDIDKKAVAAAEQELTDCITATADVSDETSVDAFFNLIQSELGGIDALINNAGIAGPTGKVFEIPPADWRRCIDVCLTGQYLCARRAVPMMIAAGGGALVNMSSAAGKHGYAYRTPYSAAKFGVIGLTQSLAKELGPDNIRVNAILPGIVDGPRMDSVIKDRAQASGKSFETMRDEYLNKISMRRMVSSKDVAATVAFLLSDAGHNISGQSLAVDGNVETL